MRWILGLACFLLGSFGVFLVVTGACSDATRPLPSESFLSVELESVLRISFLGSVVLSASIASWVFAGFLLLRPSVSTNPGQRDTGWGKALLSGLFLVVGVLASIIMLLYLAAERAAPAQTIGALFVLGSVASASGLVLSVALCCVPKSRMVFGVVLTLFLVELTSIVGVYVVGSLET